jgi:hypothetical protein
MTQSCDLVLGKPQLQDPSVTCNAISLGVGFTAKPVQAPTSAVAPPAPGPNPCDPVDAGAGG